MFKKHKLVPIDKPISQRPILLWPGVVIVMLQWLVRFVLPAIFTGLTAIGVLGGLFFGLAFVVWWAFFSRALRLDRWGAAVLMIAALIVTSQFIHESIETGMRGMMFYVYATPVLCLAFVIWAVACRGLSVGLRRVLMVLTILLSCGVWILIRSNGINWNVNGELTWRWAESAEERLLAQSGNEPGSHIMNSEELDTDAEWPGFRGPHRNGIIHGVRIETDWSARPPVELWRRPIGPGCSSFAVQGNALYTQEQRGGDEVVACYNMTTGDDH